MAESQLPEPWLRGTLADVSAVQRAVLHALELAGEDLEKWCGHLSDAELNARPSNLAPVAFHTCGARLEWDHLAASAVNKSACKMRRHFGFRKRR